MADQPISQATRVEAGKPSRLPAGSTLEVSPGVHVPHPHAEVNLPGMGDPRLGDTVAVTEYVKIEGEGDGRKVTLAQRPLDDIVKPSVLTVAKDATPVEAALAAANPVAAAEAKLQAAVDDSKANVTAHHE